MCTAKVIADGKSYGESQESFSDCMNEALGNTASHWEKVEEHYRKKYEFHDWQHYADKYEHSESDSDSSSGSSDSDDLTTTEIVSSTEELESTA